MEKMDRQKLAMCAGADGGRALIAYRGKVYDVTSSPKWKNGRHMMRHSAGSDLTAQFGAAPHGEEVFERFEQVSILEDAPDAEGPVVFRPLSWLYSKFPRLKRHAHPMVVHFPIAFLLGACLFTILFLFTKNVRFEDTAFHLALLGALASPFAVLTGIQSWRLFYGMKRTTGLTIKLVGGPVVVGSSAAACLLRLLDPDVLLHGGPMPILYAALLCFNVPLVVVLGYIGAKMTFPD